MTLFLSGSLSICPLLFVYCFVFLSKKFSAGFWFWKHVTSYKCDQSYFSLTRLSDLHMEVSRVNCIQKYPYFSAIQYDRDRNIILGVNISMCWCWKLLIFLSFSLSLYLWERAEQGIKVRRETRLWNRFSWFMEVPNQT